MKSKKLILRFMAVALFGAAILTGLSVNVDAYPGKGGRAERVTVDQGDTMTMFNLSVGSTTAVQVYQKQAGRVDRKVVICNGQAFNLYVGTSSGVTASNANTLVPDNSCQTYLTPSGSLWAIWESAAGAADLVNGFKQLDSRD